jgi:hypothetical protein
MTCKMKNSLLILYRMHYWCRLYGCSRCGALPAGGWSTGGEDWLTISGAAKICTVRHMRWIMAAPQKSRLLLIRVHKYTIRCWQLVLFDAQEVVLMNDNTNFWMLITVRRHVPCGTMLLILPSESQTEPDRYVLGWRRIGRSMLYVISRVRVLSIAIQGGVT